MAILYTSGLEIPSNNLVDLEIARIELGPVIRTVVSKYSAIDAFIEDITPVTVYVENSIENKTHIRVYLSEGQLVSGEKLKIEINNS